MLGDGEANLSSSFYVIGVLLEAMLAEQVNEYEHRVVRGWSSQRNFPTLELAAPVAEVGQSLRGLVTRDMSLAFMIPR